MKGGITSAIVVVALVQLMAIMPGDAMDCGQVKSYLAPCVPFLTGANTAPSTGCCGGVKNLNALAATTADRRAACDCVKAAAANLPNIQDSAASSLPSKCSIDFKIPISKTTNCQTIN